MKLFMSYAHENIDAVRELVNILRAANYTVWFDEQLLPGQDWKQELGNAIMQCQVLVYVMTTTSLASEWCQWELSTASHFEKSVIPILLEPHAVIPAELQRLQYADFTLGLTPIAVAKFMAALGTMQKLPQANVQSFPVNPKGIPSRAWDSVQHWTDLVVPKVYEPQNSAEEIVEKLAANLMRGAEGVGGRMIITTQRILFEAHMVNIQGKPLEIPLAAIQAVYPTNLMLFVPTGLTIECKSGEKYTFAVSGRERIISTIKTLQGVKG